MSIVCRTTASGVPLRSLDYKPEMEIIQESKSDEELMLLTQSRHTKMEQGP
jgi:hypothetical protein